MSEAYSVEAVSFEDELKQSYLSYAMSVLAGRALPDARDGCKPVHRRVLYAMHELSRDWRKSARVVGDVIGKYHPHGEMAVYDALVRMAQTFSLRYPLIDGQGNFGSVDGDAPAAARYTEVRLSKMAHVLLADLDKETVDFVPNYDGSETAPAVLPSAFPNLLVNGSSGIAVGMATSIPPHHLGEVLDACFHLIQNPEATVDELMAFIPGPDFPTAGIIHGSDGILQGYRTGRGRVVIRARTMIEEVQKDKTQIVVTELPYQVNKARLIEKIAELVKEKKIEGISGLRDESDKDGMRMVIELKRGEQTELVLNHLYSQTAMQSVFSINMVALCDNQPKVLNLKQILEVFVQHRREVVIRRMLFDLNKAKQRAHLLEGFEIILLHLDEVIHLIKGSVDSQAAKIALISREWPYQERLCYLSSEQAQAVLELRLHRLTGLERDKINQEYLVLQAKMTDWTLVLNDTDRLMVVISDELKAIKEAYHDSRRTEIVHTASEIAMEDLITREQGVVTLSHSGYVKFQSLDAYRAQHRGGKGKTATQVKDEDFVERLIVTHTHDTLLCFSTLGKVYWIKVYKLPSASRTARGKPIVNVLPSLGQDERITAMLTVQGLNLDGHVVMATASGTVKKTPLTAFSRPRTDGIIAIDLQGEDKLIGVGLTQGENDIMLFSDAGKVIRFHESAVRPMGRMARGVRGIRLKPDELMVSLVVVNSKQAILTTTENGYGKRTALSAYRQTGRGGQGVISIQVTKRNGKVVKASQVSEDEEVMLITEQGTLVRIPVNQISEIGRNTQGVKLIQLRETERLVGMQRIEDLQADQVKDLTQGEDKPESVEF